MFLAQTLLVLTSAFLSGSGTGTIQASAAAPSRCASPAASATADALAATFDLNADWGFDPERFRAAVEAVAR